MIVFKILFFLFLLLALAALGHDAWYYYNAYENGDELPLHFSELGFLWLTYAREYHDMALDMVGADMWGEYVRPVLLMPAVYVAAMPALLFGLLYFVFKFAAERGFSLSAMGRSKKSDYSGVGRKEREFKYKRK